LIDGQDDIDPAWFDGARTVLVTAGASAPDDMVAECVDWLCQRFDARVETRTVCSENVRFELPAELRDAAEA